MGSETNFLTRWCDMQRMRRKFVSDPIYGKFVSDPIYSRPAATFEKPQSTYVISTVIALDSGEK